MIVRNFELDLYVSNKPKPRVVRFRIDDDRAGDDQTKLWMAVGQKLAVASRTLSSVRMGALREVYGSHIRTVCDNKNISAGFNVVLQENDRKGRIIRKLSRYKNDKVYPALDRRAFKGGVNIRRH